MKNDNDYEKVISVFKVNYIGSLIYDDYMEEVILVERHDNIMSITVSV